MKRALEELVQTERLYVAKLEVAMEVFLKPLRTCVAGWEMEGKGAAARIHKNDGSGRIREMRTSTWMICTLTV
jgi:hypothetical protein